MCPILSKIKSIFNDNPDNLKSADNVSIWSSTYNTLERKARCYDIVKAGYFEPENSTMIVKLDTIINVAKYTDNKYRLSVENSEELTVITKQEYYDLRFILKNINAR